jgi:outer membrane receptor for ferrienterochelin and colicins
MLKRVHFDCLAIVGAVCLLSIARNAQAQSDTLVPIPTQQLREIPVVGTFGGRNVEKEVMKITVFDSEKIRLSGANNLAVFLQQALNFRIQQDNLLGAGVSIMGISGENVKILRDGVPMIGRQNGNLDLTQIPLNNVERIEIVEGSASVLYGTNALAGVINLVSKNRTSKEGFETQLFTYQESNGHHDMSASVGYRHGVSNILFSGSRNFFTGWSPPSDSPSRSMLWKPRLQYFADVVAKTEYKQIRIQFVSSFFNEIIKNLGVPLMPYKIEAFDDTYKTQRFNNSLTVNKLFGNTHRLTVLAARNDYERIKNTVFRNLNNFSENLVQSEGGQDTTRFSLTSVRASFARFDSTLFRYELGTDINMENGIGARLVNKTHQIGDYALFASGEWNVTPQLTVRPAIRMGYNTVYTARPTPAFNVLYKPTIQWTVRAGWSQGFRAPSLKELYLYFVDVNHNVQGNENLKAEASNNLSFNVTKTSKDFRVEMNGFFNDITNLITLAQKTPVEYTYININRFQTYGINIGGRYQVGQFQIAPSIGLLQQVSYFTDKPYNANTMEVRAQLTYSLKKQNTTLGVYYKYNGRQPGFGQSGDGVIENTFFDAYQIMDFTANTQLWKSKIWLTTGVKNILDVTSVAANIGSNAAHSSNATSAAIGNGRTIFLAINLKIW